MRFWMYFLFALLYMIILFINRFYDNETIFVLKSLFLTLYLSVEIIALRFKDRKNWIVNPVVLASVFTFLLGYGITNLQYLMPNSEVRRNLFNTFGNDPFVLLSNTMDYIILGAVMMWVGYKTDLGLFLYRFLTTSLFNLKRYFKNSFHFNINLIYAFIILSVLVRFYAMLIGVYGYAQDPAKVVEAAGITQYIGMLGALAQYSLLVIALAYYSEETKKSYFKIMALLIGMEVFFGIMSGMKSLVVMPVVIPMLAFFILKRKVKKSLLVLAVLAIAAAYIIIEPFRLLRTMDPNFQSTPKYVIQTLYNAYILNKQVIKDEEENASFFLFAVLGRNNYMVEASMAIDYENRIGLNEYDPDFLERLYFAPLHAVIPRFLWVGKPFENTGLWFTRRVIGVDYLSSTGFTPFGYLYFAGGLPFILIFFFVFGIMQNALFRFIELGSGGIIIFLGLLSTVVLIDTSVNGIFVTWIRNYPLLIILQYFTFKR